MHTKPVYSKGVHKTSLQYRLHKTSLQYTFYIFVIRLSHIEKLAAQKYSFNLIYKHLTWAASENFSNCLLFYYFFLLNVFCLDDYDIVK